MRPGGWPPRHARYAAARDRSPAVSRSLAGQRGALVAARGDAVAAGEPAGEVSLVAEAGLGGGRADRPPPRDQPPCGAEPELALVVAGRHPVRRRERAVDGEPAPARRGGQVGGGDVVEVAVADQLPDPPGD